MGRVITQCWTIYAIKAVLMIQHSFNTHSTLKLNTKTQHGTEIQQD